MDWMLLLFPAAFLALTSLGDDDPEPVHEPEPEPEPQPEPEPEDPLAWLRQGSLITLQPGGDSLVIDDPAFSGRITGSDGDDRITVTTDDSRDFRFSDQAIKGDEYAVTRQTPDGDVAFFDPRSDLLNFSISSPIIYGLTEIQGGEGNDTITASGSDMWIEGGPGADLIDIRGLRNGAVFGGEGDTILGSDHGGVLVYGSGGGSSGGTGGLTYIGSDLANDTVEAEGAAQLFGGGGNDWLTGGDDGAYLSGGEGNDVLRLNGPPWPGFHSSHIDHFRDYVGNGSGTADGGAGNDRIMFDHADTVTGGPGADSFLGWLAPGETALITDFDPSEDQARITVETLDPAHPTGGITIEERGGDSFVLLNGAEILHLRGATGIPVAINLRGAEMDEIRYVDAAGNPVELDPTDPQARPLVIGQHITLS